MSCRIVIIAGPMRTGEVFDLENAQPIGIGKYPAHLIQLMTPNVSRNHATLCPRDDGGWRIQDNHSTNGVFVNGQRVRDQDLCDGDIVRIGEFVLRFEASEPSEPMETLEEVKPPGRIACFGDHAAQDEPIAQLTDQDQALPPIGVHLADASIDAVPDQDADLYDLVEPEPEFEPMHTHPPGIQTGTIPAHAPALSPSLTFGQTGTGSRTCMSCGQALPPGAKVCVACGIDLVTGKRLVTSRDIESDVAIRADTWIRIVSWILPLGLFPIASEAFATKKPHATWVVFAFTLVCSTAFFIYMKASDDPSPVALNLMHWTGSRAATDKASAAMVDTLVRQQKDLIHRLQNGTGVRRAPALTPAQEREIEARARALAADLQGAPEGVEFHWYQLLTCALLHGGILHIAGNMLFLLVFGLRVNELIGSWKFAIVYPLLAIASSGIDGLAHAGQPLQASLGASGAIMGLAGMYLVFFPIQRVHLAAWIRMRIFWMAYKVFTIRGFWLLLIWVGLNDLLPMALGAQDHVAHWAHLGGFGVGIILAIGLLLSGSVDVSGADLLSMLFGRRKHHRRQTSAALT